MITSFVSIYSGILVHITKVEDGDGIAGCSACCCCVDEACCTTALSWFCRSSRQRCWSWPTSVPPCPSTGLKAVSHCCESKPEEIPSTKPEIARAVHHGVNLQPGPGLEHEFEPEPEPGPALEPELNQWLGLEPAYAAAEMQQILQAVVTSVEPFGDQKLEM
ncbi:unnamed protein product [Sphagnum tenellum]